MAIYSYREASRAAATPAAEDLGASASAGSTSMPATAETEKYQWPVKVTLGVLALQGAFSNHIAAFRRLQLGNSLDIKQVRRPADLQHLDALVIPGGESTCMRIIGGEEMIEAIRDFVLQQRKPVWGTCAGCILLADSVLAIAPAPTACDAAAEQHGPVGVRSSSSRGKNERQQHGGAGCIKAEGAGVEQQERGEAATAAATSSQKVTGREEQRRGQGNSCIRTLQQSRDGYGSFVGGAHIQVCRNFFGRQVDSFEAPLRCTGRLQGVADGMVAICIRAPAILKILSPKAEILAYVDHPDAAEESGGFIAGKPSRRPLFVSSSASSAGAGSPAFLRFPQKNSFRSLRGYRHSVRSASRGPSRIASARAALRKADCTVVRQRRCSPNRAVIAAARQRRRHFSSSCISFVPVLLVLVVVSAAMCLPPVPPWLLSLPLSEHISLRFCRFLLMVDAPSARFAAAVVPPFSRCMCICACSDERKEVSAPLPPLS